MVKLHIQYILFVIICFLYWLKMINVWPNEGYKKCNEKQISLVCPKFDNLVAYIGLTDIIGVCCWKYTLNSCFLCIIVYLCTYIFYYHSLKYIFLNQCLNKMIFRKMLKKSHTLAQNSATSFSTGHTYTRRTDCYRCK